MTIRRIEGSFGPDASIGLSTSYVKNQSSSGKWGKFCEGRWGVEGSPPLPILVFL